MKPLEVPASIAERLAAGAEWDQNPITDDEGAAQVFYRLIDGERTLRDVRAGRMGGRSLLVYNKATGMWCEDFGDKHLTRLAALHKDKLMGTDSSGEQVRSYGGDTSYKERMFKELAAMAIRDPDFLDNNMDTSVGFLHFSDSILNMETGQQRPFTPEIVSPNRIPRPYRPQPDADKVAWVEKTVFQDPYTEEQLCQGVGEYVKLACALMLYGDYRSRWCWFMQGSTGTGKGFITDVLLKCCGSYFTTFSSASLAEAARTDDAAKRLSFLKRFAHKRGAIANEMRQKVVIDGELFKSIVSGGDRITVRSNNVDETEIRIHAVTMFACNDIARINPCDDAVQDRVHGVASPGVQFVTSDNLVEGDATKKLRDPHALTKFDDPEVQDAFVHVLIKGFQAFKVRGGDFVAPPPVAAAKKLWFGAEQTVEAILKERFDFTGRESDCVVAADVLVYVREKGVSISSTKLGLEIKKISGFLRSDNKRVWGGGVGRCYFGVCQRTGFIQFEELEEDPFAGSSPPEAGLAGA
jgi:hypothetical protein